MVPGKRPISCNRFSFALPRLLKTDREVATYLALDGTLECEERALMPMIAVARGERAGKGLVCEKICRLKVIFQFLEPSAVGWLHCSTMAGSSRAELLCTR